MGVDELSKDTRCLVHWFPEGSMKYIGKGRGWTKEQARRQLHQLAQYKEANPFPWFPGERSFTYAERNPPDKN